LKVQDPDDQEIADLFLEDVEKRGGDTKVGEKSPWWLRLSEDEKKDYLK